MIDVADLMTTLAACLCVQIENDGSPAPCFCGVVPGSQATFDFMGGCGEDDGMAWVRLATSYPATAPGIVSQTPNNCGVSIGVDLEVGIVRTMNLELDQDPSSAAAAAMQQVKDMQTIVRAINCCSAIPTKDTVLGPYVPLGPGGGVVGGSFTVMVHQP